MLPSLCQRGGFTGRLCDALHLLQSIWHTFSRVGGLLRKRDPSHNLTKKKKWISSFFCSRGITQKRKEKNASSQRWACNWDKHVLQPTCSGACWRRENRKKRGYSHSVWGDFSAQRVVQVWGDEWEREEFSGWHAAALENKHWIWIQFNAGGWNL